MSSSKIESVPSAQAPWYRSLWFRWVQLMAGLFIYGLAASLMIRSGLGLGPWDAFHVGLHLLTGMSIGTAAIFIGLLIVGGTYLAGMKPGPGTLANMVFIGVFVDLLLPVVPEAGGWKWGLVYFLLGVFLVGFATGQYIGAGLGKGPRDGLMMKLSEWSGWPVRRVRLLIEMSVLAGGWAMGATIGIGTVLFAVAIGPLTQWALKLFGASVAKPEIAVQEAADPAEAGGLCPVL